MMERKLLYKPSAVYVISSPTAVKVGRAADPEHRRRHFQSLMKKPMVLHFQTEVRVDGHVVEKIAHEILRPHVLSTEWFTAHPDQAIEAVSAAVIQADVERLQRGEVGDASIAAGSTSTQSPSSVILNGLELAVKYNTHPLRTLGLNYPEFPDS